MHPNRRVVALVTILLRNPRLESRDGITTTSHDDVCPQESNRPRCNALAATSVQGGPQTAPPLPRKTVSPDNARTATLEQCGKHASHRRRAHSSPQGGTLTTRTTRHPNSGRAISMRTPDTHDLVPTAPRCRPPHRPLAPVTATRITATPVSIASSHDIRGFGTGDVSRAVTPVAGTSSSSHLLRLQDICQRWPPDLRVELLHTWSGASNKDNLFCATNALVSSIASITSVRQAALDTARQVLQLDAQEECAPAQLTALSLAVIIVEGTRQSTVPVDTGLLICTYPNGLRDFSGNGDGGAFLRTLPYLQDTCRPSVLASVHVETSSAFHCSKCRHSWHAPAPGGATLPTSFAFMYDQSDLSTGCLGVDALDDRRCTDCGVAGGVTRTSHVVGAGDGFLIMPPSLRSTTALSVTGIINCDSCGDAHPYKKTASLFDVQSLSSPQVRDLVDPCGTPTWKKDAVIQDHDSTVCRTAVCAQPTPPPVETARAQAGECSWSLCATAYHLGTPGDVVAGSHFVSMISMHSHESNLPTWVVADDENMRADGACDGTPLMYCYHKPPSAPAGRVAMVAGSLRATRDHTPDNDPQPRGSVSSMEMTPPRARTPGQSARKGQFVLYRKGGTIRAGRIDEVDADGCLNVHSLWHWVRKGKSTEWDITGGRLQFEFTNTKGQTVYKGKNAVEKWRKTKDSSVTPNLVSVPTADVLVCRNTFPDMVCPDGALVQAQERLLATTTARGTTAPTTLSVKQSSISSPDVVAMDDSPDSAMPDPMRPMSGTREAVHYDRSSSVESGSPPPTLGRDKALTGSHALAQAQESLLKLAPTTANGTTVPITHHVEQSHTPSADVAAMDDSPDSPLPGPMQPMPDSSKDVHCDRSSSAVSGTPPSMPWSDTLRRIRPATGDATTTTHVMPDIHAGLISTTRQLAESMAQERAGLSADQRQNLDQADMAKLRQASPVSPTSLRACPLAVEADERFAEASALLSHGDQGRLVPVDSCIRSVFPGMTGAWFMPKFAPFGGSPALMVDFSDNDRRLTALEHAGELRRCGRGFGRIWSVTRHLSSEDEPNKVAVFNVAAKTVEHAKLIVCKQVNDCFQTMPTRGDVDTGSKDPTGYYEEQVGVAEQRSPPRGEAGRRTHANKRNRVRSYAVYLRMYSVQMAIHVRDSLHGKPCPGAADKRPLRVGGHGPLALCPRCHAHGHGADQCTMATATIDRPDGMPFTPAVVNVVSGVLGDLCTRVFSGNKEVPGGNPRCWATVILQSSEDSTFATARLRFAAMMRVGIINKMPRFSEHGTIDRCYKCGKIKASSNPNSACRPDIVCKYGSGPTFSPDAQAFPSGVLRSERAPMDQCSSPSPPGTRLTGKSPQRPVGGTSGHDAGFTRTGNRKGPRSNSSGYATPTRARARRSPTTRGGPHGSPTNTQASATLACQNPFWPLSPDLQAGAPRLRKLSDTPRQHNARRQNHEDDHSRTRSVPHPCAHSSNMAERKRTGSAPDMGTPTGPASAVEDRSTSGRVPVPGVHPNRARTTRPKAPRGSPDGCPAASPSITPWPRRRATSDTGSSTGGYNSDENTPASSGALAHTDTPAQQPCAVRSRGRRSRPRRTNAVTPPGRTTAQDAAETSQDLEHAHPPDALSLSTDRNAAQALPPAVPTDGGSPACPGRLQCATPRISTADDKHCAAGPVTPPDRTTAQDAAETSPAPAGLAVVPRSLREGTGDDAGHPHPLAHPPEALSMSTDRDAAQTRPHAVPADGGSPTCSGHPQCSSPRTSTADVQQCAATVEAPTVPPAAVPGPTVAEVSLRRQAKTAHIDNAMESATPAPESHPLADGPPTVIHPAVPPAPPAPVQAQCVTQGENTPVALSRRSQTTPPSLKRRAEGSPRRTSNPALPQVHGKKQDSTRRRLNQTFNAASTVTDPEHTHTASFVPVAGDGAQ